MSFKLEKIVLWGRSFDEYRRMFNLSEKDLEGAILDCAGGPADFNAEMYRRGKKVISADPIYQFSAETIKNKIDATCPQIIEGLKVNYDRFVWREIKTPQQLGEVRMAAMNQFLADYQSGLQQGRYLVETLPHLSFQDFQFDLALCSHLLFTYSEQLSLEFHIQAIQELLRVARQVRIFPLLENFTGEPSPHLASVIDYLKQNKYQVEIIPVNYEFQIGGNQMMQIIGN